MIPLYIEIYCNISLMINDLAMNYLLVFILCELFEVSWQKAPSIMGMLLRMYMYYSKNVILFLIMNPTFYFAIGFAMLCDFNVYSVILLFLKSADIVTKIILIDQVFGKKELTSELSRMLLTPLSAYLPYVGFLVYPPLILLAI